jgi:putative intracellular protease/amidase
MPVNYGLVLYPGWTVLDVFGPLEVLNGISDSYDINLSIIASSLGPVTAGTFNRTYDTSGSTFALTQTINPTHTFAHPPENLDVLLVPGGVGSLYDSPELFEAIAFIKHEYPRLQYIFTVCTGSTLLARAGVLDGKRATTNKSVWKWATSQGPKVNWVPVARWVVDGNIWTTSGVAAGIDGAFAYVGTCFSLPSQTDSDAVRQGCYSVRTTLLRKPIIWSTCATPTRPTIRLRRCST